MQHAALLAELNRNGLAHWRHAIQWRSTTHSRHCVYTLCSIWARQPRGKPKRPVAAVRTTPLADIYHVKCRHPRLAYLSSDTDFVAAVMNLVRAMERVGLLPMTPATPARGQHFDAPVAV